MGISNTIKKIGIIELLIAVCWSAVVLIFANYDEVGFYFWGGFGFGILAFVIAAISLFFADTKNNRNTTEINFIPVYYTIVYLAVVLCANTIFIFGQIRGLNIVLVTINLVALVIFASVRIFTGDYGKRVEYQTEHIANNMSSVRAISASLTVALGMAQDQDIKKQLVLLKEKVDYSANVSQTFSREAEDSFLAQLNQIQVMLQEKKAKEDIEKKIQEAIQTWNRRNGLIATMK